MDIIRSLDLLVVVPIFLNQLFPHYYMELLLILYYLIYNIQLFLGPVYTDFYIPIRRRTIQSADNVEYHYIQ